LYKGIDETSGTCPFRKVGAGEKPWCNGAGTTIIDSERMACLSRKVENLKFDSALLHLPYIINSNFKR
jgi:hypothetical protein